MNSTIKASLVAALLVAVAGCPGKVPSAPGMPGSGGVDPNTCGNYAASDAGRKLKGFFEATVALDAAVKDTENYVKDSCLKMGKELGFADLDGNTQETCSKVLAELKNHLKVGLKAEAKLKVDYKPAVCTVNIEAAAKASAKCEAKAEADIAVRCEGTCSGTCSGKCDGKCAGSTGDGGQCDGQCEGTCEGSCSGGCEGHANVEASAECKAEAEVTASVAAECTEPELDVSFDAEMVVDATKVEAAVAAIKAGLPQILLARAKVEGPLKAAFTTWGKSAKELAASANKLAKSFDDQAMCVAGQISAAAGMLGGIQASLDVQVSVSVEASASAGVN